MNCDILNYFVEDMIPATPYTIAEAPDDDGNWVDTEIPLDPVMGLFWRASQAASYLNKDWAETVTAVFVVQDSPGWEKDDRIDIGSEIFYVDAIDDIVNGDSVYSVGLRATK